MYTFVSQILNHIDLYVIYCLYICSRSLHQRTPLHVAVIEGQVCTVEYLVDNGADIRSKDENGVIT